MRACWWLAVIATLAGSPAAAQSGAIEMSPANGTALADPGGADIGRAVRSIEARQGDSASRQEVLEYQENLRVRRAEAVQYATAARQGVTLPPDAAETLRRELSADIEQWRKEFAVGRQEARAMRDQWLAGRDSLTALEWADRRVEWWAARDAWVAKHRK